MVDTTLAVELWSAGITWRQGFIDQLEVLTAVVAERPVRVGAARADDDTLVLGRHPGELPEHDHLPWTEDDARHEDLQLSRTQLRFVRGPHGWRVEVPGPARSRRSATLRYWASARARRLEAGTAVALDPDARACLAVTTHTTCYWALVHTPPDPTPGTDLTARGGLLTEAGVDEPRPIEDSEWLQRRPRFPERWQEAMEVKFRPFLTWPMDVDPALVEPRHFIDPQTGRGEVPAAFQNAVKKRLIDTQAAAVARGFKPRLPSAVDERLLEWLVSARMLSFEDGTVPWAGPL